MKKILLFFCSFIFVFLIKTNSVNAFFVIDDYNMDCTVLENGDMYVKETLEYSTDEYRNGVYRDIITINPDNKTNSASSLELYKVYVNGTQYNLSKTANNGDTGIFLYTKTDTNTYRIKVYTPFDYQGKIIQYEYKLTNVAVKYNDTAELFWNFVGKGWQDQINQLTVKILLPIDSANNKIYVFGHGSDNGTFTKRENNITLKASNIKPGQAIDARILFSRDAINKSKKIQDKNVLEKYINTEEKMYKNKPFNIFAGVNLLAMSLSIIVILAWIIIYLKFDKEEKGIKYKYFREIPLNMNPEIIEYLYKRKASSKTVWVTFLSLIKKGFFKIEKGTNAIGGETYNICYIEKNKNGLLPYEANFISWITSYFDNNNEQNQKTVSLLNLKNNIKNDKGSYSSFNSFEEDIKKEATTSFGEWLEIPTPVKIGCIILMAILIIIITISAITAGHKDMVLMVTIFLILTTAVYSIFFTTLPFTVPVISFFAVHFGGFQIANIMLLNECGLILMYIPYILLFFLIQYLYRAKKYTKEQKQVINQINGLKRFINDFSILGKSELGQIVLWEDFFIIAIALNLNKKILNKFYNHFIESNVESEFSSNIMVFGSYSLLSSSFNSSFKSIGSSNSNGFSNNSPDGYSGSDGGFSSGGGSGGGGGGGGGGGSF